MKWREWFTHRRRKSPGNHEILLQKVSPQIIHDKQKSLVIKLLDSGWRVLGPVQSSTIYDQTLIPCFNKKKCEKSNLKIDDMKRHDVSNLRPYKFSDFVIVCSKAF